MQFYTILNFRFVTLLKLDYMSLKIKHNAPRKILKQQTKTLNVDQV